MKISIEGTIIDTKNIYCINEVSYGSFSIISFNKNILTISEGSERYWYLTKNEKQILDNKLNKLRDSIIKIWSENQPTIPQFNLE